MLYRILKIPATIALRLYVKDVMCDKVQHLKLKGPLLLACNHPNSFLDAIILCSLFDEPIYSLARGDVFKNPFVAKILASLNILPVYRTREGVENLEHNYKTFEACRAIFKKGGIVLIFSEGLCENEWHLRPLKKGTARLAISTWDEGTNLKVLPVSINYSSFKKFGKTIVLNLGEIFGKEVIDGTVSHGQAIVNFNKKLNSQLKEGVYEIAQNDTETLQKTFERKTAPITRLFLILPALIGYFLHWPLIKMLEIVVNKRFGKSGHYDSVIIGSLFFLYPVYLLIISAAVFFATAKWYSWLLMVILPLLARATLLLRKTV